MWFFYLRKKSLINRTLNKNLHPAKWHFLLCPKLHNMLDLFFKLSKSSIENICRLCFEKPRKEAIHKGRHQFRVRGRGQAWFAYWCSLIAPPSEGGEQGEKWKKEKVKNAFYLYCKEKSKKCIECNEDIWSKVHCIHEMERWVG